MFNIKGKNYLKGFVLISLSILLYMYVSILQPIYSYDSSRIYDITLVNDKYGVSLINKFLDKQYAKSSILVLGDSQPNGFRYPTKYIFSTVLSKKLDKKVINAAFGNARVLDHIYVLEYLKNKNREFETIIFNVNPAHLTEMNRRRFELNNAVDYKIGILKNNNAFKEFSNNFNPATKPDIAFYAYDSLPNFFDMPDESLDLYLLQLEEMIILAKSISKHVIIYAAPHCSEEIQRLNLDRVNINKLESKVLNICNENNVTFLKPEITEKKYFNDIVHFNSKGHIQMADILYRMIKNSTLQ